MAEQQLTYEGVLEMFRETREQIRESEAAFDRRMQKTERIARKASKSVSKLGNRIGDIIENMVGGNALIRKFRALGYNISEYSRKTTFGSDLSKDMRGEIDLFLVDGDIAILVEVKTTLQTADVRSHIERLGKYRRCADVKGDKRRFIGAVAGAVVEGDAQEFAHENGMYVIVQSGEAVTIVPVPEGFKAKEW